MDDSMGSAVLEAIQADLAALWTAVVRAEAGDLETAESTVRDGVLAIGGRVLEASVAARGTGKAGARIRCGCGAEARGAGYRRKQVQTVVGWITLRRASYACPGCGQGHAPLDEVLGLERDSHRPGVRRLAWRCGGRLPLAQAAQSLAEAARIQLSASTVRPLTEAVGARREQEVAAQIIAAWGEGRPPASSVPPERLYVAMDGVRILGPDGGGREVKVGVVQPVRRGAGGERREPASYAAGREPASYAAGREPAAAFGRRLFGRRLFGRRLFGRRLALEAPRRGLAGARMIAVLGDGAAWIWNLAAEHFPGAVHLVDWCHASARIWDLGRALYGAETGETATWVGQQVGRLALGPAATLATAWRTLPCRGEVATLRDAQVTYFTNQASRMAYDRSRAAGWDLGSGMVESACKHLIAARENGAGRRWSEAGAHTVAAVRVLLSNEPPSADALAA